LDRDSVRAINSTYRRSGTLWEGRFRSSLVDETRYCLAYYRYIELNPVRAGMVTHPADYPWSSFRCNAMGKPNGLITPHECLLGLGESHHERITAYRGLFNDTVNQRETDDIRQGIDTGLPTGNERFRLEIEQALSVRLGNGRRGRPRKSQD